MYRYVQVRSAYVLGLQSSSIHPDVLNLTHRHMQIAFAQAPSSAKLSILSHAMIHNKVNMHPKSDQCDLLHARRAARFPCTHSCHGAVMQNVRPRRDGTTEHPAWKAELFRKWKRIQLGPESFTVCTCIVHVYRRLARVPHRDGHIGNQGAPVTRHLGKTLDTLLSDKAREVIASR